MPKLGLHFQGGFDGDEVVVTVGGREVLRRAGLRTRKVVGLAARAEVEVPDGPWTVAIALPGRGIEKRLEIPAGEEDRKSVV
jgi:hypothetical protein